MKLFDAQTGPGGHVIRPGNKQWPRCVAFSPYSRQLAARLNDGTARLYDAATGAEIRKLVHGSEGVCALDRFQPRLLPAGLGGGR